MRNNAIITAVSAFQAARAGHDRRRKSEATRKLTKAAVDFLSADGQRAGGRQRLKALAAMLTG